MSKKLAVVLSLFTLSLVFIEFALWIATHNYSSWWDAQALGAGIMAFGLLLTILAYVEHQ